MKSKLWERWKGYSGWKRLGILTLLGFGFAAGFILGYIRGSSDMAALIVTLADRAIDSANISVTFSDIATGYLNKAGVR